MVRSDKRSGLNLTLIVQDENWNKLATFKWNSGNKGKQKYIIKTLEDAFGINFKSKTDIDWIND